MSLRTVPGSGQQYHLISYDDSGAEVADADGTWASETALSALAEPGHPVTDVFILCHGWQGDLEDAVWQYDSWIGAGNPDAADDGVTPFLIGIHWPSKAWSDRELVGTSSGLLGDEPDAAATVTVDQAVEDYASRLGDSGAVRAALRTVLDYAAGIDMQRVAANGDTLPADVAAAYRTLASAAGGDGDSPLLGASWDPGLAFGQAIAPQPGDGGLLGEGWFARLREAVLSPLRQLTFWHSKDQARAFGESGAARLLRAILARTGARVHLMGHSFGTIVVSGAVRGPGAVPAPPPRPVSSMFLVQGAVSLWAFAADVPAGVGGGRGYFADVLTPAFVRGPVVATHSQWDYAVGKYYPLAVGLANQYLLGGDLPKFGGIGAFGIQGAGALDLPALTAGQLPHPELVHGSVYNVDASAVIATLSGAGGAHTDLAHPELTWLAWSAALAAARDS